MLKLKASQIAVCLTSQMKAQLVEPWTDPVDINDHVVQMSRHMSSEKYW
jgi:hypothetical protein